MTHFPCRSFFLQDGPTFQGKIFGPCLLHVAVAADSYDDFDAGQQHHWSEDIQFSSSTEMPGIGVLVRNITIQHKNGIRNKVNENQLTATNYGNELWSKKVDKIEISPPAQ